MNVIKKENCWCDDNNNTWDLIIDFEIVESLAKTLINCHNCHNCHNCTNCNNCVNSAGLVDCNYCIGCRDSTRLSFCRGCHNCNDCLFCYNCTNCSHIDNVVDYQDCVFNKNPQRIYSDRIGENNYQVKVYFDGENIIIMPEPQMIFRSIEEFEIHIYEKYRKIGGLTSNFFDQYTMFLDKLKKYMDGCVSSYSNIKL